MIYNGNIVGNLDMLFITIFIVQTSVSDCIPSVMLLNGEGAFPLYIGSVFVPSKDSFACTFHVHTHIYII